MTRSRSGQHRKVEQARAVVDQALGDATRRGGPHMAAKYMPMTKSTEPDYVGSAAVGVLTLKEAAGRLGIGTDEMKAIVKRGTLKTLMAGWTVVVPTSEVERLRAASR